MDAPPAAARRQVSRIDLSTRARTAYLQAHQGSEGLAADWGAFRLERWSIPGPIQVDESALSTHLVVLNVGTPITGYVRYAGESGERRTSPAGMVGVTPAGHPYVVDCGPCEVLALGIDAGALAELALGARRRNVVRPIVERDAPLVRAALLALADDVRAGQPFGPMYGETLCATVAVELLRLTDPALLPGERGFGPADREFLRDHIERHLAEPLQLRQLAALVGLSPSGLSRAFKASFGLAPHAYVLQRRLERARQLLRGSRLPLTDVALACGFASQSHFTDAFTLRVGQPPGRYRRFVAGAIGEAEDDAGIPNP